VGPDNGQDKGPGAPMNFDDLFPAGERLARRHPMQVTGGPELPYGTALPALDRSGSSMEHVKVTPDRDYPDDFCLAYQRSGQGFTLRFTPDDRSAVAGALLKTLLTGWRLTASYLPDQFRTITGADVAALERVLARQADEGAAPDSVREMRASHATQAVRDVLAMLGEPE
jgi:hypothetical protein